MPHTTDDTTTASVCYRCHGQFVPDQKVLCDPIGRVFHAQCAYENGNKYTWLTTGAD